MLTPILGSLLLVALGGGIHASQGLTVATYQRLSRAAVHHDASAYPLAHDVLLDIADRRYTYYRDARVAAFEYIRAMKTKKAMPLIKEIAKIPTTDEDSLKNVLDAWAVREALDTLLSLGSKETAELSRHQLFGHPFVQLMAIQNLEELEYWDATPDVERMLCSTPPDGDHHVELKAAGEFLEASPDTSHAICACLDKISIALGDKFYAPIKKTASPFYRPLGDAVAALGARLNCK
jgi:hypothetical protein